MRSSKCLWVTELSCALPALAIDPECHYDGSVSVVEKECVGKQRCTSILNTVAALDNTDPCPGEHWNKRFLATVQCA
eukprot:m.343955 g.343955  ORF g.343955 m.343955 type:complete len:77 (-) comp20639_c0_seq4:411-641(-)